MYGTALLQRRGDGARVSAQPGGGQEALMAQHDDPSTQTQHKRKHKGRHGCQPREERGQAGGGQDAGADLTWNLAPGSNESTDRATGGATPW